MGERLAMRDVIFLLPGIGGSVLTKHGAEVWAPTAAGLWGFLKSRSKSLEELILQSDDPDAADLGDGVDAPRLVDDIHIIPGLWKIDGYSAIRDSLARGFELYPHSEFAPGKANYVEFPYDWRRDNRAMAHRLSATIDRYLGWWQKDQHLPDARAILLAHSMGGLVARYWLEALGGWQRCRALVTFGTPHRGSPKAVRFLANGYKPGIASLTRLIQSCTSVYQLLPIYPMLSAGGELKRVAEAATIPNLRADKAAEALQFHRSIEEGVKADHAGSSYTLLPMVGTGQPTLQSGVLNGGGLTTSEDPPPKFDRLWSHGDGTVPYVSAIPIEMSTELRLGYVCEQHGSIQNNYRVLDYLYDFLRRTQTPDLTAVRFEAKQEKGEAARPGLSVAVDDYYEPDETPVLSVSLVGNEEPATRVQARVEAAGMGDNPGTLEFAPVGEGWELAIPCLGPGVYRAHIRASMGDGSSASPVTGIFEVGG